MNSTPELQSVISHRAGKYRLRSLISVQLFRECQLTLGHKLERFCCLLNVNGEHWRADQLEVRRYLDQLGHSVRLLGVRSLGAARLGCHCDHWTVLEPGQQFSFH